MQKITHLVIGAAIGMLFSIIESQYWFWFLILGAIAAIVPDSFDFKVFGGLNHRNIFTHNFFSPLLILFVIIGMLFDIILFTLCGILSFESHQILDMQNPSGVYCWNRKFGGQIQYDNVFVNLMYICGGIIVIFSIFLTN